MTRTISPPRAERGVTLIEVMIASAVMLVGVLGLLPLLYNGTAGVAVASRITQATALAQSRLEYLERLPFSAAELATGTRNDGDTNLLADGSPATSDFGTHDGGFYRTVTIEAKDYNTAFVGDDYKLITVEVAWWDGAAGRERSVAVIGGRALLQ